MARNILTLNESRVHQTSLNAATHIGILYIFIFITSPDEKEGSNLKSALEKHNLESKRTKSDESESLAHHFESLVLFGSGQCVF